MSVLEHAIFHITSGPERWPRYLEQTRRYVMHEFPFSVVYRVEAERILVVAVAHQRRRPGYWASRL